MIGGEPYTLGLFDTAGKILSLFFVEMSASAGIFLFPTDCEQNLTYFSLQGKKITTD